MSVPDEGYFRNESCGLSFVIPTKCRFIWLLGFRGEDFLETNQSETRIAYGGHVC